MRRDLADYLLITMVVGLLLVLTTGCADRYVARINSDCRLLPNTTVESNGADCTVCYHKGTAVAACIVTGDADVTPPRPSPPCLNCTPEETP